MKAFIAVAEELNFGRAAQLLHIAQPAVSQQIFQLERYLGIQLFDRNKRTVRLTDAGSAFLEPCRAALRSIEAASGHARNAGTGEFGRIRIGFNAGFTTDHLVALVRAVHREYPNIELVIDSSKRNSEVLENVEKQDLDLGLVGGPVRGEGLSSKRIWPGKLGVLMPPDHPLAQLSTVPSAALKEETLILMTQAPGWTIRSMAEDACGRAGFSPKKIIEVTDGMTLAALVNAKVGLGFATTSADYTTAKNLVLLPLAEEFTVQNCIVWKATTSTPALNNVLRVANILSSPPAQAVNQGKANGGRTATQPVHGPP